MARIDRLEDRIKEVLFGASVIGREFSRPVLEHVIEKNTFVIPGLRELQAMELILEKEEAHELEYLFKHYLIQEVAYNTILIKKRKQLHKLIAQSIEKLYSDRLKEFYELLAFHYEKAEEWEKAAEYLNRAGRKVGEFFGKEESKEFFDRKDAALAKVYESASEKRIGWIALAVVTALAALPLALVMLAIPGYLAYLVWNLYPQLEFSLWGSKLLGNIGFFLFTLLPFLGAPLIGLLFVFLGVIPLFRGRPKLYDLWEDQIRVVFRNGKTFSIKFSDIHRAHFYDLTPKTQRKLIYKILDPFFEISDYSQFSIPLWFNKVIFTDFFRGPVGFLLGIVVLFGSFLLIFIRNFRFAMFGFFSFFALVGALMIFHLPRWLLKLPPYSFGFSSSRGELRIERSSGWDRLRILLPWLHSPSKSQFISLTPSDPKEFYEQFEVAYSKWKKTRNQTHQS
jgi:hypothetical protein